MVRAIEDDQRSIPEAQRAEWRAKVAGLGVGGFALSEPQVRTVVRGLGILERNRLVVLATPCGSGKTAMAIAMTCASKTLHPGNAVVQMPGPRVALLFVPENIRRQWIQCISQMLAPAAYAIMHITMDDMPFHSEDESRQERKDSTVWKCIRGQWPLAQGDGTVFVFVTPAVFNEQECCTHLGKIQASFVVVDEVHKAHRKTESTAGENLGYLVRALRPYDVQSIFISATPVVNLPSEPVKLALVGNLRLPAGERLERVLIRDGKKAGARDGCALLTAVSCRGEGAAPLPGVPNNYVLVCRVDDAGFRPHPAGGSRVSAARRSQHGNSENVRFHPRWRAAAEAIGALHARGVSIGVCAENKRGLADFAQVLRARMGGALVYVITSETQQAEYDALLQSTADSLPVIVLITPQMAIGLDWSFLGWMIFLSVLYILHDLVQVNARMVRIGQKSQTVSLVLTTPIDKGTYEAVRRKCKDTDEYYEEAADDSVPDTSGLSACPLEEMGALASAIQDRLPRLTGPETCEQMCADHQARLLLWKRVSHLQ